MLSHANVMAGSTIVSTYLEIASAERILAVLPFSFDAGLNQLMTAFHQGQRSSSSISFRARHCSDASEGAYHRTGRRAHALELPCAAELRSAKQPLPDLRYITNTGGAMPQAVLAILRKALPTTKVFLMYGLTEAFRSTYLPPSEVDRRPTSMGKAIPDTEILVSMSTATVQAG